MLQKIWYFILFLIIIFHPQNFWLGMERNFLKKNNFISS